MAQKGTILYSLLKPWVRQGAFLFFRKLELHGLENFPSNRPVILVANHQNAMLDPVVTCLMLPKQLHWLTRADVFKKPLLNKLLRKLNMLPVYRERDKVSDIHKLNNDTFQQCYERLAQNAVMCVFPEGTHRGKKQLIQLKKGVARMANTAVQQGLGNLCILPVGLDYESYYNYRTTLLLNIGKPIEVLPVIEANTDPVRTQNMLLDTIRACLKEVMLDIEDNETYEATLSLQPLCNKLFDDGSLYQPFKAMHNLVHKLNQDIELRNEMFMLATPYTKPMQSLGIIELYYRENGPAWYQYLYLIVAFIPALIGIISFLPIYILAKKFIDKVVKEPLFVNSIRICIWTFLTPLYIALLATIVSLGAWNRWWWLPTAAALVVCGVAALPWLHLYRILRQHLKCRKHQSQGNAHFFDWLKVRSALIDWIKKNTLNTDV